MVMPLIFKSIFIILVMTCFWDTVFSKGRESKHLEDKINSMDHAMKQQIMMMQKANVPKDTIATKIKHAVGGNMATAHRVIDGINDREQKIQMDKLARSKRKQQQQQQQNRQKKR